MERFKMKSQIGELDLEALSADLDPGEQKVLQKTLVQKLLNQGSIRSSGAGVIQEGAQLQQQGASQQSTALKRRQSTALKRRQSRAENKKGNTESVAAVRKDKIGELNMAPVRSGAWIKLRGAVNMQDESEAVNAANKNKGEEGQGEGDEIEVSEEEQKQVKKILKAFKRNRSADLIEAERKTEAGEELNTREKLAVFMAEKKLKKAFSRAQSIASEQSDTLSRAQSGALSLVSSATLARVSSSTANAAAHLASSAFSRIGSFTRTLSGGGDPDDSFEAFQRASGDAADSRRNARESAIDQVISLSYALVS
jgi:hypothetical protein